MVQGSPNKNKAQEEKKRSVRETARTQDLMATFPTCVFIMNH